MCRNISPHNIEGDIPDLPGAASQGTARPAKRRRSRPKAKQSDLAPNGAKAQAPNTETREPVPPKSLEYLKNIPVGTEMI